MARVNKTKINQFTCFYQNYQYCTLYHNTNKKKLKKIFHHIRPWINPEGPDQEEYTIISPTISLLLLIIQPKPILWVLNKLLIGKIHLSTNNRVIGSNKDFRTCKMPFICNLINPLSYCRHICSIFPADWTQSFHSNDSEIHAQIQVRDSQNLVK